MAVLRFAHSGLLLAAFWSVSGSAQAPIERRVPPTPSLSSLPAAPSALPSEADRSWQQLESRAHHGSSEELRVQANGEPLRCRLDGVTGSDLYCTEYRVFNSPVQRAFFPPIPFKVPRSEIREVRSGGRELSTLVGAAAGVGFAAGVGSARGVNSQDTAFSAVILGLIGAGIGHLAPFKGHVVYRQP